MAGCIVRTDQEINKGEGGQGGMDGKGAIRRMYGSFRRALEYIWVPSPSRAPMMVGVAGMSLWPVAALSSRGGPDGVVRVRAMLEQEEMCANY